MIPFMRLEPRNYNIPRPTYRKLRAVADDLNIPISTLARSLIERFRNQNNDIELKLTRRPTDPEEDEMVSLPVRLAPKTIEWLTAVARKNNTIVSNVVASIIEMAIDQRL